MVSEAALQWDALVLEAADLQEAFDNHRDYAENQIRADYLDALSVVDIENGKRIGEEVIYMEQDAIKELEEEWENQ